MKCPNCKSDLNPKANFCIVCGEKVYSVDTNTGSITINSNKSDSIVYVNGNKTNYKAPCVITNLKSGKYDIFLLTETHYSDKKAIVFNDKENLKLDIELNELLSLNFLTKHKNLIFFSEGFEIKPNSTNKVRHGHLIIEPSLKDLPNIDLNLEKNLNEYTVNYDNYIEYSKITFKNFPSNIILEVRNNEYEIEEHIEIKPVNEEKYLLSDTVKEAETFSQLLIIPGSFILKWRCENSEGEFKLEGNVIREVDFYEHKQADLTTKRNKKVKTFSIISIVILLLFGPYLIETYLWAKAKKTDTVDEYKKYINKYSYEAPKFKGWDSKVTKYRFYPFARIYFVHFKSAKEAMDNVRWKEALQNNTISAYLRYIKSSHEAWNGMGKAINKVDSICIASNLLFDKRNVYNLKIYKTVKIGNQVWTAEDFSYEIGGGKDSYMDITSKGENFGFLYSWEGAKRACPSGWHLPSDNEWKELERFLGMPEKEVEKEGYRGTNEGSLLKTKSGWENDLNNTDKFGFSAIPVGMKSFQGWISYDWKDTRTSYWTSTLKKTNYIYIRDLSSTEDGISRGATYDVGKWRFLRSVRYIKDEQ